MSDKLIQTNYPIEVLEGFLELVFEWRVCLWLSVIASLKALLQINCSHFFSLNYSRLNFLFLEERQFVKSKIKL